MVTQKHIKSRMFALELFENMVGYLKRNNSNEKEPLRVYLDRTTNRLLLCIAIQSLVIVDNLLIIFEFWTSFMAAVVALIS